MLISPVQNRKYLDNFYGVVKIKLNDLIIIWSLLEYLTDYFGNDFVLGKNQDLWDLSDVVEADKMRIVAKNGCRAETRIQEDNESELLMHELV